MNEHDISIHVNKNSRIQLVQPEFTTWKYKLDQSATKMLHQNSRIRKVFVI